MIRKILLPALLVGLLGGCVTGYTYRPDGGGYYYGQPSVEYRYHDYGYGYGYPYHYGYYPYQHYYGYGYGYPYYYGYYGYPYGYYGYPYRRHHHRKPPVYDPGTDPGVDPGTDPGREPRDGATRNDFRHPPSLRNLQPRVAVPMQPAQHSMPRPIPQNLQGPRQEQSRRDPPVRTESGNRRSTPMRRPTQSGTQER